ncbi:MAG TPA: Ig-like domain-containing protein, partial [Candidatus Eisenbacteria bacterium]
ATVNENALLTVNVTASDPDGQAITTLTASGTAITAGATFAAGAGNTSGTLSWTPTFTQSGTYAATFTATNALSGSATTNITVNNVDRAPTVTAPASATGAEGSLLTVNVTASDPDGQAITSLTATGTAITAGATFAAGAGNTSGTLSWTPTFTQAGTYAATFTATNALSGSATTNITVNNVDRAPTVTAPASATVNENALLTVNVTASDPDGDAITSLTATGTAITAGATFAAGAGNTSGTLSWTPTFAQSGTYAATFTATNALSGSATTNITVNNVDRAPVVTAPSSVAGSENNLLTFTVSASDPDGDTITSLTATGTAITAGATFTSNGTHTSGTLSWTPTSGQSGSYSVTFTATNALTGSATTAISISTDNAPVVTAPATATVNEGALLTVNVSAVDPDGDAIASLTASGTAITAGATFAANASHTSGTLTWTPTFTQAGTYAATFTASNALSGSATTNITVNNVDHAPTVSAPATATVNENALLTVNVTASDADGDAITSLTASGSAITAGATFAAGAGNTSGTLTWTPSFTQAGTYSATFTATNALSGSATTAITVNNSNRPPVVTAPPTAMTDEGVLLTFGVSATDPDGDHVTLSAPGRPAGSSFTDNGDNTGTFSWTPTFADAGTYSVTFVGNDGNGGSANATTAITVNNVNRPPVANVGGPYTGVVNVSVSFNGTASSDPDGDALSFAWDFGDGGTGTGSTVSHPYTAPGAYLVTLTVMETSTPDHFSDTDTTTVPVSDVFPATAFTVGGNTKTSLGAGKPYTTVQVQPKDASFMISDVDLTSIKMVSAGTGSVSEIFVDATKTVVDGDKNGDGITEIAAAFRKADLRLLFSGLPAGNNNVPVKIQGNITTGGTFSADLILVVKSTGAALAANISPNPLNPQAKLTFATSKPGAVRVQMFDLQGRLVKTIVDERNLATGYHDYSIDGTNANGGHVASGVYFVRVWSQFDGEEVVRVTVLK